MAKAELNFSLLIEKAITQTEEHYSELITQLTNRKSAILSALGALNKCFIENHENHVRSIANINLVTNTISKLFKNNDSLDKKFCEKHDRMCTDQKEKIWKRMEDSFVKFEHRLCIENCVRASGSIQLEGLLTQSIEELRLDRGIFELEDLQPYKGRETNASLDVVISLPLDESIVTCSNDFKEIAHSQLTQHTIKSPIHLISSPAAICIDPEKQLIYAVNGGRVPGIFVFTLEGEYLETIRPPLQKSNACLYGICVGRGRIYVTDTRNNMIIAISQNAGEFIAATCGRSVFNSIQNLAIDTENGQIFACDKSALKIRIFDELLHKISHFGERFLAGPRDVKVRKDNVIVLDSGDYSLCYFSKAGVLLGHSITFFTSYTPFLGGIFFPDKARVQFFDIDDEGNSYITNFNSAAIHKFDMFGGYLSHSGNKVTYGIVHTKGIAVGNRGKVLYACTSKEGNQIQCLSNNK